MTQLNSFLNHFSGTPDPEWTFLGHRSINHLTHGYHRYPAKFVPRLVKKLIEDYTTSEDIVVDMFAGCGTTLVEAKAHGRESIGVDINPVAQLITRAKITAIEPEKLEVVTEEVINHLKKFDSSKIYFANEHSRVDYWFRESEKNKIGFLYKIVLENTEAEFKDFFLCALSNILKTCSRWLQSSTKPQIDPDRNDNIPDPFDRFLFQIKQMTKKNAEFYQALSANNYLDTRCEINEADARSTGIESDSIGAVITSPPYVTSYEYADIHQLTGYWFEYISEIAEFRKKFIGTFYSGKEGVGDLSPIATEIVAQLRTRSGKYSREAANYFSDMSAVAVEMHRILKPGGTACIVIGNTTLKEVEITSAQALAEMLELAGLSIVKVIKRQIPNKLIPTIRDKNSGRFTTLADTNSKEVYPEEYIIIAKKASSSNEK